MFILSVPVCVYRTGELQLKPWTWKLVCKFIHSYAHSQALTHTRTNTQASALGYIACAR